MAITGITATNVNGIQDVSTTQNIGVGVNAIVTDEALLVRASILTSNTTGTLTITNSAIKVGDLDLPFSYGVNTGVNSTIELNDSYMEWNIANTRRNMRISKLVGTHIRSTNTGASGLAFLYTQAGNKAILDSKDGKNSVIDGIFVHEIAGAPLTYRNTIYKNCGLNILNYEAGDLPIRNVSYGSGTIKGTNYTGADGTTYNTYDAWIGGGNSANKFRFYDCVINLAKLCIQLNYTSEMAFKYFSRSEKYLSGTTALSGLNIRYKPTASTGSSSQAQFFVTTNGGGLTSTQKIDLLVQNTINSGTARSPGIAGIPTAQNFTFKNITWERRVRGYAYQSLVGDATPTAQVGNTGAEAQVYLLPVSYITLTETQANALTGISLVASGATGGTVTITGARTVAELWQFYRAWISKQANFDSDDTWSYDGTNLNIGAWTISGIEFLTGGKITTSTATANGTISNLSIVGDVSQTTPTNLSNVQISGTLTYNTNTATSIAISNGTEIGTVTNSGTDIVTISRDNTSSITDYTDAEINFLDSNLLAVGITSATIYGSQSDRDTGANPGATFTTSLDFKYGSEVSGVTMQDTVYLRVVVGSVTLFTQITLVTGSNVLDLSVQGQLSAINAKVDLTAKEASLEIVNQGVQKASKIIPHNTNI